MNYSLGTWKDDVRYRIRLYTKALKAGRKDLALENDIIMVMGALLREARRNKGREEVPSL